MIACVTQKCCFSLLPQSKLVCSSALWRCQGFFDIVILTPLAQDASSRCPHSSLKKGKMRKGGPLPFSSVAQSCPTLCKPMNRSTPGLPVHHYLPESTQTHVHRVDDAIQPSHPLSSPSPAFNLSQPALGSFPMSQFFESGSQMTGASVSVPPMNIQGWFPLGLTGLVSLQSKWLSRIFSITTVWEHQFFSAQPSLWSNSQVHDYWKNHSFNCTDFCRQSDVSAF